MTTIKIKRVFRFSSCLVPFWVIFGIRKQEFMDLFHLPDDLSFKVVNAYPVPRLGDVNLRDYGVPIYAGKELTILSEKKYPTLFAMSSEGLLSNEICLDGEGDCFNVELTVISGWKTPSYPSLRVM